MLEVHPEFSEAPHSRSPIPHPKPDFSKNQIESPSIFPLPKYTKGHFPKQDWHPGHLGLRSPVIQKTS